MCTFTIFSNSPKREDHLIKCACIALPHCKRNHLIDVCRTRWVERIDGLDRVVELLNPRCVTLEDISLNKSPEGVVGRGSWNSTSSSDAGSLLKAISFEFLITLVVVKQILGLTRSATVKLQAKNMDLISADTEISLLKQVLREYQEGIAQKHRDMHEKAALMGEAIAIEPKCPRVVGRQVYRDNALASNPEDYYRVSLTNPF